MNAAKAAGVATVKLDGFEAIFYAPTPTGNLLDSAIPGEVPLPPHPSDWSTLPLPDISRPKSREEIEAAEEAEVDSALFMPDHPKNAVA